MRIQKMKHNFTLMKINNLNQLVLATILFASIFIVGCNNEQSNYAESAKTDVNESLDIGVPDKKVACYYCGMFPQPEEIDTGTLEGSMAEINVNSKEQVTVARQELNTIYDSLTHLMANEDPNGDYKDQEATFLKNLKNSQELWEKYMEAQCLVKYPEGDAFHHGTCFALCWNSYREGLIRQRSETLRLWLTGYMEGDICSGTIIRRRERK